VGRLDDLEGVQRVEMRSSPDVAEPVQLRVRLSSGETLVNVLPAGASLRATTGRPGAAASNALFLIDNPFGAGRSITLNFWMTDYPRLRNTPAQRVRLAMLRDYLSLAGVQPLANVRRASGEPLACSEVVGFRKGVTRYLAILPEPDCADGGPIALGLPAPQFVYDLRAHRLLGRLNRVGGTLVAGEPLLYALESAPIGHLSIQSGESGRGERPSAPAGMLKDPTGLSFRGVPQLRDDEESRSAFVLKARLPANATPSGQSGISLPRLRDRNDPPRRDGVGMTALKFVFQRPDTSPNLGQRALQTGGQAGLPTGLSLKAGDAVKFQIRLTARPGEVVPESAAHVEVRNPAGVIVDYYGAEVPISNGAAEFAVPLALDDSPGVWRVTAREPFTHQTASAIFLVTR
jgi:hypothetical protein